MSRLLVVRLGALGDIIHALPAAQALREAHPDAQIDWLVDWRYEEILRLVPMIDRRVVLAGRSVGAWREVLTVLRAERYDAAIDFQGLLKSAVLARASGAPRVIGLPVGHLRERVAGLFYTERPDPGERPHVVHKNLAIAAALGATRLEPVFPLQAVESTAVDELRGRLSLDASQPFALINPGAGWPNKRWPVARYGAVAAGLREHHAMPSAVLWGPGEEPLAAAVAEASGGAAQLAPRTTLADLVAVLRAARLMVSGDSGPLHIAAAVGTPVVGIYGPTSGARNGPWSSEDVTVSRFDQCVCHHRRRCRIDRRCLDDVTSEEVDAAIERRLFGLEQA